MNKFVLAVCAALLLAVSPTIAFDHVGKSLNPFANQDNGTVVTPNGTVVRAALPPITLENEKLIFAQLDVVVLLPNDWPNGGISLVVNRCGGADAVLSFNEWFYYHGAASAVTFCGHPFPSGTSS